ncbi:MAG: 4Fe-4S binding protein, partial [Candidatus Limnocylindrales bacterium]
MSEIGLHATAAPAIKQAGEPKELHEARLGPATTVLDVGAYVDDFNTSIVDAYRRGLADRELPSDSGIARSVIPPGTAATRDFSGLAGTIPAFMLEACVGCMSCVNACPDSAIIGIAQPESVVEHAIGAFASAQPQPARAEQTARAHFARTTKYADVPARHGLEPAAFGIFVDPVHCKGCAECVEVCHALGYDALKMIPKLAATEADAGTVDGYARDMRLLRSLPPTPPAYRNERALADLMLGEHAFGYVGGAGSCSGCGEASAIPM